MCDDFIVDLKNRDGDFSLSVTELKQAFQAQKVLERDTSGRYTEVLNSFGVGGPMPKFCTPGLRM